MERYIDIWGVAEDHFGIITTKQAEKNGVAKQCLVKMAERGALTRLGRGVYQVKHHVRGPHDHYAAAIAIVGEGAYLCGASVLALLELCPTNPSLIYVGSPMRVRRRLDDGITLRDMRPCDCTEYFGLRCQRVADALKTARDEGMVDGERIVSAAREAEAKGLISHDESAEFQG